MSEIVFDLKVNMDNASFYDNNDHLAPGDEGICRDYNGNTVGKWIVSKNNSPQI